MTRRKLPGGRIASGDERNAATLPLSSAAPSQSVSWVQHQVDLALARGPMTIEQIVDQIETSARRELVGAGPRILAASHRFVRVVNGWRLTTSPRAGARSK